MACIDELALAWISAQSALCQHVLQVCITAMLHQLCFRSIWPQELYNASLATLMLIMPL